MLIWAINAKYAFTVKLMEQWAYKLVDSITWVKKTVNGKMQKVMGIICSTLNKLALLVSKETAQSFSLESQRM
jgi:N6-adenosine-specific RNA methylase IME4